MLLPLKIRNDPRLPTFLSIPLHEAVEAEQNFQRPNQLIDAIFTQPFTKVSHVTDAGLYAENTARSYLNKLDAMGVLEKKEIKGRHYYRSLELEQILTF